MKKLIALTTFTILLIGGLYSQDNSLKYSETFARNTSYTLADSTSDADSTFEYEVFKISDARMFPTVEVGLDSVGGTAADVKVILYKKISQFDDYAKHDSITWAGMTTTYNNTTADTILQFSITTAAKEEYWKIEAVGSDATFHYRPVFTYFKFLK